MMRDNPLGKIPTLVREDDRVFDSVVLCEYLDGRYGTGNLFPQDSGRALARAAPECARRRHAGHAEPLARGAREARGGAHPGMARDLRSDDPQANSNFK
jgi:glutathione S-transferase